MPPGGKALTLHKSLSFLTQVKNVSISMLTVEGKLSHQGGQKLFSLSMCISKVLIRLFSTLVVLFDDQSTLWFSVLFCD